MVEIVSFSQGGIYLAKLDPVKRDEVGKLRPVIILTAPLILAALPHILFICPLSSKSHPTFSELHITLPPRDSLHVTSYALVEHCRAISTVRLTHPRLSQLTSHEINLILKKLQNLVGL